MRLTALQIYMTYYLLNFRCYERPNQNTVVAGVTGAIVFALVAVSVLSSIYALYKFRENRRLKEEIIELENEADNRLTDMEMDSNKQRQ